MASGSTSSRRLPARAARHGCSGGMAWPRRTVVQVKEASSCVRHCTTVVLYQGSTGSLSSHAHLGWSHSGNWQIALPFIIGGDFQGWVRAVGGSSEPKQLEDSGWVRAVGGFATVTPSHRVIDFFVVSRDVAGACDCVTQARQNRCVHAAHSTHKRATSRSKRWPAVRPSGCRRRLVDLDRDPVRGRVQEASGAQPGVTSFIDLVEEEHAIAFLIASDPAGSFRGRSQSQKLVWQACKSLWCDKFPRGSYEVQSWRRKSRNCNHIHTARQRVDELLLRDGHIDHTYTLNLIHELLVVARQTHKLAAVPMSLVQCARRQTFWKLRLRTIAEQPA